MTSGGCTVLQPAATHSSAVRRPWIRLSGLSRDRALSSDIPEHAGLDEHMAGRSDSMHSRQEPNLLSMQTCSQCKLGSEVIGSAERGKPRCQTCPLAGNVYPNKMLLPSSRTFR